MVRQTSLLAYWDLPETPINLMKQHIMLVICKFGGRRGMTDSEIIKYLLEDRYYSRDMIDRLEPRVRRHEMCRDKVLVYNGKSKCYVTGKSAMVWKVRGYS